MKEHSTNQPAQDNLIDIALCVDATGSMAPCRATVNRILSKLHASLAEEYDARFMVIGYRDFGHDLFPLVLPDGFERSLEGSQKQLNAFRSNGGGDHPECGMDAIYAAIHLDGWRPVPSKRFVLLLSDAPSHSVLMQKDLPRSGYGVSDLAHELQDGHYKVGVFSPDSRCWDILKGGGTIEQFPISWACYGHCGIDPEQPVNWLLKKLTVA